MSSVARSRTFARIALVLAVVFAAGGAPVPGGRSAPSPIDWAWIEVGDQLRAVDLETGALGPTFPLPAGGSLLSDPSAEGPAVVRVPGGFAVLPGFEGVDGFEGAQAVVQSADGGRIVATSRSIERLSPAGRIEWSRPLDAGERVLALAEDHGWLAVADGLIGFDFDEDLRTRIEGFEAGVGSSGHCLDPVTQELVVATRDALVWIAPSGRIRDRAALAGVQALACARFGTIWVQRAGEALLVRTTGERGRVERRIGIDSTADVSIAADPRDNSLLVAADRRLERWSRDGERLWRVELDDPIRAVATASIPAGVSGRSAGPSAHGRTPPEAKSGHGGSLDSDEIAFRGQLTDPYGRPVESAEFAAFGREIVRATSDAAGQFETGEMPYLSGDQVLLYGSKETPVGAARSYPWASSFPAGTEVDLGALWLQPSCWPDFEASLFPANDLNGEVRAIAVFDDGGGPALFVGGTFTTARGVTVNRVAKWNGSSWSALGSGLGAASSPSVDALLVFDDGSGPKLYAGGNFTTSGAASVRYVARWTGSAWVQVGSNLGAQVLALGVFDPGNGSQLFATGAFTSPSRIARLSGSSWVAVGTGLNNTGRALAAYGSHLYVGGSFTTAGGASASRIARWNGSSWSAVGSGVTGGSPIQVNALAPWTEAGTAVLAVGGRFTTAGGTPVNHVARWNGTAWSAIGSGLGVQVNALTTFDSGWGPSLFAAGTFTTISGESFQRIARFETEAWLPLGSGAVGVNGSALALTSGTVAGPPGLFVGGAFTSAGGNASSRLARWSFPTTCDDFDAPQVKIVDPSAGESIPETTPPIRVAYADAGLGADPEALVVRVSGQPIAVSCSFSVDVADCVPEQPLAAGTIELSATIEDLAGNLSLPDTVVFSIAETDPPALSIVEPAEGSTVTALRPPIRFHYTDPGAGVDPSSLEATWNGASLSLECQTSASEALCVPTSDRPEGTATIVATVRDFQGNLSSPAARTFVVDAPAPLVTTVRGSVRLQNGSAAATARVWLVDRPAQFAIATADGSFEIPNVELAGGGELDLGARWTAGNPQQFGFASAPPVPGGETVVDLDLKLKCFGSFTPLPLEPEAGTLSQTIGSLSNAPLIFEAFDDGDGADLYAGGSFNVGSGGERRRIARWGSGVWENVGGGIAHHQIQPDVRAFALFDDGRGRALYAGGEFTWAGSTWANHLARWDGTAWEEVGRGVEKQVHGLAVFDDGDGPVLFVSGEMTRAGTRVPWTGVDQSVAVGYVATWDGETWRDVGAGVTPTSPANNPLKLSALVSGAVRRLFLWEENGEKVWERVSGTWSEIALPAGSYGLTSLALHDDGSGPTLHVAAKGAGVVRWNGSGWIPLLADDMLDKHLASFADEAGSFLYAAGGFPTLPGDDGTAQIRRWTGSAWSLPLGPAERIQRVEGDLATPILLRSTGSGSWTGSPFGPPAVWSGGAWLPLAAASEVDGSVTSVAFAESPAGEVVLFAGPTRVGALQLDGAIARWDGSSVTATSGLPDGSRVFGTHDGLRPRAYAVAEATGQIAEWAGDAWQPMGDPVAGEVRDVRWIEVAGERRLYAAGDGLFRWNGAFWGAVAGAPTPTGFIEGFGGQLYTSGRWRWNGATWSQLPTPPSSFGEGAATDLVWLHDPDLPEAERRARELEAAKTSPSQPAPESVVSAGPLCGGLQAVGSLLHFAGQHWAWNGSTWVAGAQPRYGYLKNRFLSGTIPQSQWSGSACRIAAFDDGSGAALVVGGDFAGEKVSPSTATILPYRNLSLGHGVDGPKVAALAVGTWRGSPAVVAGGDLGEAEGSTAGRLAIWHAGPTWETCSTGGPPAIVVTSPESPLTNQPSVTVTGALDESADLTVDGAPVELAPDFSFAFATGPLREGENRFFLRAVDATDLVSTLDYVLVRDSTPPVVSFVAPPAGASVYTGRPRIDLEFEESGSGVDPASLEVSISGVPLPGSGCIVRDRSASCRPETPLPLGPATIRAAARDRAGNLSNLAERAITVESNGEAGPTTVVGTVRFLGGDAAAGARVRILGRSGLETAAGVDGGFSLVVPDVTSSAPLRVIADLASGPQVLNALSHPIPPVPNGTTDAGVLTLAPACDLAFTADLFGSLGVDGRVLAAAIYDAGDGPQLYLGGTGLLVGSGSTSTLARWNGTSFEAVPGSPASGSVRALAVWDPGSGPELFVGGTFTLAGSLEVKGLASWDGSAWRDVGGGVTYESSYLGGPCTRIAGSVYSLLVGPDGGGTALFVGGSFNEVGAGIDSDLVAKWDGSAWSSLGAPSSCPGTVNPPATAYALATYDEGDGPALFAAGNFSAIAGVPARNIARRGATGWAPVDSGVGRYVSGSLSPSMVNALAVYDGGEGPELVAAGLFNRAGSSETTMNSIARWNGERWAPLGPGLETVHTTVQVQTGIQALAVFDDGFGANLFAIGKATGATLSTYGRVARWNGTTWRPVAGGVDEPGEGGMVLLPWGDELVAGGGFASAGGRSVRNVARWNGQRWRPYGDGLDGDVEALAVFDDGSGPSLYVGGAFLWAGDRRLDHVARFDGSGFQPLGAGVDGTVLALGVHDDGTGPALYAGGKFAQAGGTPASNVARWNGTAWSPLGSGLSTPFPYQTGVAALESYDDGGGPALYAGGQFSEAGGVASPYLARWRGGLWSGVGPGVNGEVHALARATVGGVDGLFVGGGFSQAGGAAAANVARWNGAWSALGTGLSSTVRALAPWSGGQVLAGGAFADRFRLWNGTTWSVPPGGGGGTAIVESLTTWHDGFGLAAFAGRTSGVGRWSGTAWTTLGSGVESGAAVRALAALDEPTGSALYLGGSFATAGGVASRKLARWSRSLSCIDTTPPTIAITWPTQGLVVEDPTPDLSASYSDVGSGVDLETLTWSADGVAIDAACTFGSGTATCVPTLPLVAGPLELRAEVSDVVGNPAQSAPVEITVDPEAPEVTFVEPEDETVVLSPRPTLTVAYGGTIPVDPQTLQLEVTGATGAPTIECQMTASAATCDPLSDFDEGAWQATATVANTEGISGEATAVFTVDLSPPTLDILLPTDGSWTNDSTPEIALVFTDAGSGIDPGTLALTVDGEIFEATCQLGAENATCVPDSPLSVGPHSLAAEVEDRAGRSAVSGPVDFTIELDFDPPVLVVDSPVAGLVTASADLAVSGTVSEIATVDIDGAAATVAPDLSFSYGPVALDEGHRKLRIRAVDRVGNETEIEREVLRDSTPPTLAFYSPVAGEYFDAATRRVELLASGTISSLDPGSLEMTANGQAIGAACDFCPPWIRCSVPVTPGATVDLRATIEDAAGNLSDEAAVLYGTEPGQDLESPVITLDVPTDGQVVASATVLLSGSVSEPATLTVNGQPLALDTNEHFVSPDFPLAEGTNVLLLVATDPAANSSQQTVTVTRDTTPPQPVDLSRISVFAPVAAASAVSGTNGAVALTEPGLQVRVRNVTAQRSMLVTPLADGSFATTIAAEGGDRLELVVVDPAGNASPIRSATVPGSPVIPADPAPTAPPIDPRETSTICESFAFLYEGPEPVQRGAEAGAVDCERGSWLRGRVVDAAGEPLSGVRVVPVEQPEVGSTLTRADGRFDLVVNGGGEVPIRFRKAGHPVVERKVRLGWGEAFVLDDVVMTPYDASTVIDLSQLSSIAVARATPVTDGDGTRRATLLFAPGTAAEIELSDESTLPVTTLTVRATEYTVGPGGPAAMPAELPPTSAYTYAVELSIDEAESGGAESVHFSRPVPFYLENFLDFPTGAVVPAGRYDRDLHVWVPVRDGRVVEILSIDSGLAVLDLSGDGQPATPAELEELDIDAGERETIAGLYAVGQTLWRVPVEHFSPQDYNQPVTLPEDARQVQTEKPRSDQKTERPCHDSGSIIECQNQVLGETLPIVGTSFALHYRSDRVPGRKAAYRLELQVSGEQAPPESVAEVQFELRIAGQALEATRPPDVPESQSFDWDGKDAFGRTLNGPQPYTARVGYTYPADYAPTPPGCTNCFGLPPNGSVTYSPAREQVTLWQTHTGRLGAWDAKGAVELGGWTLTPHHTYDRNVGILYLGDGSWRKPEGVRIVTSVVGDGTWGSNGDGGPASGAQVRWPEDGELRPDGGFVFVDQEGCRLRRVGPDGVISTLAGSECPPSPFWGDLKKHSPEDGLPATQVQLAWPTSFAFAPDGSIYIADRGHGLVRWIDPRGVIWSVMGRHEFALPPPGRALHWQLISGQEPRAIAFGPDGMLYYSLDSFHSYGGAVFRVDLKSGKDECVLGCGQFQGCHQDPTLSRGVGGPAREAGWVNPEKLRFTREGDLLVVDSAQRGTGESGIYPQSILRVRRDGILERVAGKCVVEGCEGGTFLCHGSSPDGRFADDAFFEDLTDVSEGWDGRLYLTDAMQHKIFAIEPDGRIRTVAGTGEAGFNGDALPATATQLSAPRGAVPSPDGDLVVLDTGNRRIRRLEDVLPEAPNLPNQLILVPGEDGRTRYVFDGNGRHLRTEDTQSGQALLTFGYDAEGRLSTITDAFSNETRIERDLEGRPERIVAPFGQETELEALAQGGWLSAVENPAGERFEMTYTPDGLLETFEDPKQQVTEFIYDSLGRLERDEDTGAGFKQITRTEDENGHTISISTALGRTTTYRTEQLAGGEVRRTTTAPDGTVHVAVQRTDGTAGSTSADGTTSTARTGPEPRYGMQSPLLTAATVTTPGGLSSTTSSSRSVTFVDPNGDKQDPDNLVSILDTVAVNGRSVTSTWTNATRTLSTTSPEGRQGSTRFDVFGRVIEAISPGVLPIVPAYDAQGRLETVTQGSRTTIYHYDADGRVEWVRDPLNREVHFSYDDAGRLLTQRLPDLRVIGFDYDANGNLTSITPPGRPAHTFEHTPVDQASEYDPPEVGLPEDRTLYAYNADRDLELVTRPDGQTIDLVYGATTGRLESVVSPRGSHVYGYHATSGNVTSISDPDGGGLAFTYDGSLATGVTWTGAVAGSVGFAYDDNFEVVSRTVNGGNPVAFGYDDDGLLTAAGELSLSLSPTTGFLEGSALGTTTDSWTYTPFGEPDVYTASAESSPVLVYDLDRDAGGRITKKTETIGGVTAVWEYRYDPAGRLDQVKKDGGVVETYGYDANSNRTSFSDFWGSGSATFDDQDRLLTYGAASFTYTANGELLAKTEGSDVTTYGYDVFGNLRTVELPTGIQIEYLVDAANRRIGKKVNGTLVQGFLWQSQLQPAAELDGAGNVVSLFVYATKANVPDYMVKNGTTYRVFTDHLGSVRLVADSTTGAIAQRLDYDPWGRVMLDTNPGFQPFNFAGGLYEPQTGLVRFGARDYDSETSRWTSKDPVGFNAGGSNLYGYVLANPMGSIDPRGLYREEVHYQRTFEWAVEVGFSRVEARLIASINQGMDEGLSWTTLTLGVATVPFPLFSNPNHPFFWPSGTKRHFRSDERATVIAEMNRAIASSDWLAFGQLLHALQDTFSHAGYSWFRGHLPWTHPDDYDPARRRDQCMELFSKDMLRRFLGELRKGQGR